MIDNVITSRSLIRLSYIEGISLLILFGIAMPLKYIFAMPLAVQVVGMAHGILFLFLVAAFLIVARRDSWPLSLLVQALVSSTIPFGMIYIDRKIVAFTSSAKN